MTTELLPVIVRIAMRYGSGALVAFGMFAPETAAMIAGDPDVAILLGAFIGFVTEALYVSARKHGGPT